MICISICPGREWELETDWWRLKLTFWHHCHPYNFKIKAPLMLMLLFVLMPLRLMLPINPTALNCRAWQIFKGSEASRVQFSLQLFFLSLNRSFFTSAILARESWDSAGILHIKALLHSYGKESEWYSLEKHCRCRQFPKLRPPLRDTRCCGKAALWDSL